MSTRMKAASLVGRRSCINTKADMPCRFPFLPIHYIDGHLPGRPTYTLDAKQSEQPACRQGLALWGRKRTTGFSWIRVKRNCSRHWNTKLQNGIEAK